jgi:hypothetical protein
LPFAHAGMTWPPVAEMAARTGTLFDNRVTIFYIPTILRFFDYCSLFDVRFVLI